MKRLFILASLIFVLPTIASAASFVITPSSGSYTSGNTVTLQISVDPAGSTIYTAMLNANFSPNTFEFVSFTLNDAMLAMKQVGYDSIDNGNGLLVKTGGYVGGINSITSFGTLVLKAKGGGAGTFTVNSGSKLLDSNNANKLAGLQTASFTIANKAPVVTPKVEVKKSVDTIAKTVTPKETQASTTTTKNEDASSTQVVAMLPAEYAPQVAAVGQSGTTSNVIWWILGILALVVISATVYFVTNRKG